MNGTKGQVYYNQSMDIFHSRKIGILCLVTGKIAIIVRIHVTVIKYEPSKSTNFFYDNKGTNRYCAWWYAAHHPEP